MAEEDWTWTLSKTFPTSKDVGHQLIEELVAALGEAGWEGSELFHIQMAAEEALINAVTHGNDEDETKSVQVDFRVSPKVAWLRFTDEGPGFTPDTLPDPTADENLESVHGRGVFLIMQMMSEVNYNDCGNEVTMIKRRQEVSA
ncbi:MAG: ATP-binding protein [Pirellulaceae bacterium]